MLLQTNANAAFATNLAEDTRREFKVEMNAMLFHSVIDGIYADKIRAPMRELATNARDAHAAIGKVDRPFDVQLPSHIDPTFKVRDYGCSLSHDDIMGLYSTMFASSKRETNEAVGMIGLGSKSPFAYTSVFTVTVWKDGKKRIYSAFIGDNNVPQIALLAEVEDDAETGVEVSFSVQTKDIDAFRKAADDVFFGFDPFPNITNESYQRTLPECLYSGNGWRYYHHETAPFRTLMVRQGCVLYPVDIQQLDQSLHLLCNHPLVVDFPIGELNVSTSREALGYDSRTIRNLEKRIQSCKDELAAAIVTEFQQQPTYLDACALLHERIQYRYGHQKHPLLGLYQALSGSLVYNGRPLQKEFSFSLISTGKWWIKSYDSNHVFHGKLVVSLAFVPKAQQKTIMATAMKRYKVVVEPRDLKLGPSRMRTIFLQNTECHPILWIKYDEDQDLAELLTLMGNPPTIDLSKVEPLSTKKPKAENGRHLLRYINPDRYCHDPRFTPNSEMVEPTSSMVYVVTENRSVWFGKQRMSFYQFWDAIWQAKHSKALPMDYKIYLISKHQLQSIKSNPMQKAEDALLEIFERTLQISKLSLSGNTYNESQARRLVTTLKGLPSSLIHADFQQLVEIVDKTASVETPTFNSSTRAMLHKLFPDQIKQATDRDNPISAQWALLTDKYPLLGHVYSNTPQLTHYLELINK